MKTKSGTSAQIVYVSTSGSHPGVRTPNGYQDKVDGSQDDLKHRIQARKFTGMYLYKLQLKQYMY